MATPRILFILKRREDYDLDPANYSTGVSTGLLNSATFVVDMLNDIGIEAALVVVTDNNDIDREVAKYQPTAVVIEALWVVPEKFEVLTRLHPNVTWYIRFHSELPFIANEGIAMEWIAGYLEYPSIKLACNAQRFLDEIKLVAAVGGMDAREIHHRVVHLPNYYPTDAVPVDSPSAMYGKDHVDIGCFGAIRPLKNHLPQAVAAIAFGATIGKPIHFHINTGRIEMKGEPIVRNLISLFEQAGAAGHKLIIHDWIDHETFVELAGSMDMGMQVSFSETFNIVAADMLTRGVPIVVSPEVPWTIAGTANPTETNSMVKALINAYNHPYINVKVNMFGLNRYVSRTKHAWRHEFMKERE
jgi:hypothetical protein